MKFTATKTFCITVIGNVRFRFKDRKYRGEQKDIYIGSVDIYDNTTMSLDQETYKALLKEMKAKKSDLLTDGRNFYTTFDCSIGMIAHPQFQKELELDNELFG
jgi:hypothetical protein